MTTYKKSVVIGFVFFGIILLAAIATYYISLGDCAVGYFTCDNATVCLPQKLVCDFHEDCKDKMDEDRKMCGNMYGSNEALARDMDIGIKKYFNLKLKYNFTDAAYNDMCVLDARKIPKSCKCVRLQMITCTNVSTVPAFPLNIVMIDLSSNRIELHSTDRFGLYHNLSYLDLRSNRIQRLPSRLLFGAENLGKLYLQNNTISTFPRGFFMHLVSLRWLLLNDNNITHLKPRILRHMQKLNLLNLSNNKITLENMTFPSLPQLNELFLDGNQIKVLKKRHFRKLGNLTLISLRNNHLEYISASIFHPSLIEIRLSGNTFLEIGRNTFKHLKKLNSLHLDYINIKIDEPLLSTINVSFLSLKGISYDMIDFNAIESIQKLEHIVYKKFSYCSRTSRIKKCFPKTDGISSTTSLLENVTLRYAVWFMAFLSCIGNVSVILNRVRDENKSVSLVIRNLAFSDMIMGVYLLLVGLTDARFRNVYHTSSGSWLKSWECVALGSLAMTSSEVSILILTFMSIERFLLISDPFGHHKLDTKSIMLSLFVIWILGAAIALFPVILFQSSTKFYGVYNSGTCFPLFIEEVYSTGWIYSAIVFLGINLVLLILIATLYTILLFSIFRTRRATSLNYFDCEVAIRFFFIVLTDISCWAPIIIIKFLVLYDIEVSRDFYSYICIFVLPLNSATNPFLYTYSTPKYRDKIFSAFKSQNKNEMNSNQITGDDSQTKVSLLVYNSKKPSKWNFFRK